jgi:hypothetical protein
MQVSQPQQPELPVQAQQPQVQRPQQQQQQQTITKAVIYLNAGDTIVGRSGGLSVIEHSSDHSGHLGLMRVEAEHGHLYMEMDAEVKMLSSQPHLTSSSLTLFFVFSIKDESLVRVTLHGSAPDQ